MTLWRLEWLRITRTFRWVILAAVFGFFGALGPLTARYLPDIMDAVGEGASVPEMGPADGITQYLANVQQIGLLAVAFVAAAALAIDSNVELAVFFRTRASIRDILVPRLVVNAVLMAIAMVFGATIAYVGTGILLDWVDLGSFLVGLALQCLYLAFVVVVVGLMGSLVRKVVTTALLSVGLLIALGLLTLLPQLAPWLPSHLLGALDQLIRGGDFEYWRALVGTIVLIIALPAITIVRLERREV